LRELGHEIITVDSESIEMHASALASACDLVIDHTDTYAGRGLYRAFVRLLLEGCSTRIVGSPAKSCLVADNKALSKHILSEAGVPVPPGIVVQSRTWELPEWLHTPLIVKPAFEHMSRGVRLLHTVDGVYEEVSRLLDSLHQPILVESYIPGRELAVSIVGDSEELEVFPILEWKSGTPILTEDFKLLEPTEAPHKSVRADLDDNLNRHVEDLARQAFRALKLRDYARFDVRLSPGGSPYFLEANTTPSLEPMEALAVSAQWAGLGYSSLVERLLSTAQKRYTRMPSTQRSVLRVSIPHAVLELETPRNVHIPPESTVELAGLLDIRSGDAVLDLGCGSGLLSIAAAKMGARRVVATDLDSGALEAAKENARRNGVEDRIEFRAGSWFEALHYPPENQEIFDVLIATPPQTPGYRPFGPKYGGSDGMAHLSTIIDGAPGFLKPGTGRLWILTIALANPQEVWAALTRKFDKLDIVRKTERPFTKDEYDALDEGLFDYLCALRDSGISQFCEKENGTFCFYNQFIRASKPRGI
jgi:D-alanine-D-alanine ligase